MNDAIFVQLILTLCLMHTFLLTYSRGFTVDTPSDDSYFVGSNIDHRERNELVRRHILRSLNVDEIPKFAIPVDIGGSIKLINKLQNPDARVEYDKIFIVGLQDQNCSTSQFQCFNFNLKAIKHRQTIAIQLHLFLNGSPSEITKISIIKSTGRELSWYAKNGHNISEIVPDWIKTNADGHLMIKVWCTGRCTEGLQTPVIRVDSTDKSGINRRNRRRDHRSCSAKQCCLRSFYFDFNENGWANWIIKPKGFQMNYCAGQCLMVRQPENARQVMAFLAKIGDKNGRFSGVRPCCVSTSYEPLKIVYTTEFGVFKEKILKNMIVKECGCQQ